jgi:hypothetical protein
VVFTKSNIFILLFVTSWSTFFSQVIDNQLGNGFDQFPNFNSHYLKQKRIKSIKVSNFTKKTGDIMRESSKKTILNFDLLGKLSSKIEISSSNGYIDSSKSEFVYTAKGWLAKEKKQIGKDWKVTNYKYDTTGQVVKEEYRLEKTLFTEHGYSIQDSLLDFETSRYKQYNNQRKRIVYNSYGNPYLDYIYYYNTKNQIIEIGKKLKMTSEINETKLFYNDKNQIDSLVFYSSLTPNETESVYFLYDKLGNIIDKKLYINKKLIYKIEFVYNEKTGMLSSILKQEIANNFLTIIRFETIYYD